MRLLPLIAYIGFVSKTADSTPIPSNDVENYAQQLLENNLQENDLLLDQKEEIENYQMPVIEDLVRVPREIRRGPKKSAKKKPPSKKGSPKKGPKKGPAAKKSNSSPSKRPSSGGKKRPQKKPVSKNLISGRSFGSVQVNRSGNKGKRSKSSNRRSNNNNNGKSAEIRARSSVAASLFKNPDRKNSDKPEVKKNPIRVLRERLQRLVRRNNREKQNLDQKKQG